jgi:molybdopterin-guanine dinucleotide biosynthesis protein A
MAETALPATTGGLLLAGGRSRRFGAEKAVARIGDRLMMDAVCDCFAPLAGLAVSAQPDSAAETRARTLRLEVLHDDPALPAGPLAGVASGLAWAERRRFRYLATAPCDAPLLPRNIFPVLLDHIGDAAAAYATTGRGPYPLCAVWRVDLLPRLRARLSNQEHPSVRSFLASLAAISVPFTDASAFANANTLAALAELERSA